MLYRPHAAAAPRRLHGRGGRRAKVPDRRCTRSQGRVLRQVRDEGTHHPLRGFEALLPPGSYLSGACVRDVEPVALRATVATSTGIPPPECRIWALAFARDDATGSRGRWTA
jgi:hypothetical protein